MNVAIINCFDTYGQRVDAICDYFNSKGHNVKVYTSNYKHIEKVRIDTHPKNYSLVPVLQYKRNLSFKRIVSHIGFSNDVYNVIRHSKIDLLWVLLPPNSLARKAVLYKANNPDTKIVLDIIDMWPETMPLLWMKKTFLIKRWKKIRDNNLKQADYIVTECDLFRDILSRNIEPNYIQTIYFSKDSIKINQDVFPSDDHYSLCYLGSINNIIDIPAIVDVISAMIVKKPVELHIIGDGEKKNELVDRAKKAGATVFYYGKIYNSFEKQTIMNKCHYGLNMMKKTVCVGLTMKSLDYFNFGLPVINNIKGDTWDLVEQNKIGVNYPCDFSKLEYDYGMRKRAKKVFEKRFSSVSFNFSLDLLLEKINRDSKI